MQSVTDDAAGRTRETPDDRFAALLIDAGGLVERWDEAEHGGRRSDWSGHREPTPPLAIAFPRSTAEVAAIVAACARRGVAIVPQGGLTGLAGGASPAGGSLVLAMDRMAAIEEVNRAGSYMVVQAGVPLQRVQEAAEAAGLLFPLDLGARGSALIGGNLATNAGGNRVLRYGMARDLTLGVEVVTADGTVLDAMNRMTKNNAGYDLRQLFIGSEGTLGIITRAVLKLHPRPTTQQVALCALDDYADVLRLLDLARDRLGAGLTAFEVMWDEFFAVATQGNARAVAFERPAPFVVLVEAMGRDAAVDQQCFQQFIEDAFEQAIVTDALLSASQRDVDDFWAIRDASGELGQRFGRNVPFDVSAPAEDLDRFAAECRGKLKAALPDSRTLVFGHIADGNIHFAVLDETGANQHRIEEIVYQTVGAWGGSITAEHGVGVEKRPFLHHSRSPAYLATMRALKAALDPANLMNPGKII